MKYKKTANEIIITDLTDFNIKQILECGQIFRYYESEGVYTVFSQEKMAKITQNEKVVLIKTDNVAYFERFFDLKTNYSAIKKVLCKSPIMEKAIQFGYGVRILNQDPFETIISFIISSNNNIKRIKQIVENICKNFGSDMGNFFAFPTREQLLKASVEDLEKMGAGYRAKYIYKIVRELANFNLNELYNLNERDCLNKLLPLSGIGPKVADCALLFAYHKNYVFPVDTWVEKIYNLYFNEDKQKTKCKNIRESLIKKFGELSGYAQQYLFYYQRELKI